ncbi:hypothetical protein [Flavobacterium psychrotrophum]|uniref:hypothetical protein n=1 Tax=Flavobacterium psychrotrophum TaxID=2294119 RepID=UPI000E3217A5|nr:hypothetical protein [Flavobacterium psychrotrophum]
MENQFLYAARGVYNPEVDGWDDYIIWSKLSHLNEVAGLDCVLNEDLLQADRDNEDYWEQMYWYESSLSGLYKTSDYVLSKINANQKFNFLAVLLEPTQDCNQIALEDYDFLGYDLLDLYFEISALTNCGGFDETFLPVDLNSFGLIDDFNKAYDFANRLYENNPEEDHANTNVIAIWRHKYIGIR